MDANGNLVTAGSLAVGLSSSTAGAGVFSATNGGPAVTTVTIPNGSSAASFHYGDTKAGTPTVAASSTGLTAASQAATITAGAATKLVVTSAPVAGAASASATLGPVTVQRQDAFGNPTTAGATTLLLASSSATTTFAATSAGAAVSQVTIAAGSAVTSFYYGDTKAGSPTITVNNATLGAVTQTETVVAGAASQVTFDTGPTPTVSMNQPFNPVIRVLIADMFGNPTSTGTVTISTSISTCKLGGTTTQQAVLGVATFTGLQPQGNASNCRLVATSGTSTATSNPFSDNHN